MSAPTTPPRQQQPQPPSQPSVHALAMPPAHHLAIPTTPTIPGQISTATPLPSPQSQPLHSSPLSQPSGALAAAAAPHATGAAAPAPSASSSASSRPSSKAPVRKVGKYQLGKTLGQGTFGKVKFATDTETGRFVAIKILDKAKIRANNMGEQIKKEISIMKLIKHPSVIQLLEVLASPTTIYIVSENCSGGELFDRIIEQGCFTEQEDLKPENLLLTSSGDLKISDFGLSALSDDANGDLLHTTCGTPNYIAPEVLMDKGYDGKAADIWSSGVILYVLLAGFLPFDETSMVELFRKIVKADFAYPDSLSNEAVSLLSIILNPDPEKRATMDDIRRHPWYRGISMEQLVRERAEEEEANRERIKQIQLTHADGTTSEAAHTATNADGQQGAPLTTPGTPADTNHAITWLGDGTAAAAARRDGLATADASPSQGMRPLLLEATRTGGASGLGLSNPATPVVGPASVPSPQGAMLIPGSYGHTLTPGHSPALRGEVGPSSLSLGAGIGSAPNDSATVSPSGGSVQARAGVRLASDASSAGATAADLNSDPLSLDEEESEIRGPIPLNAFDLINMVGGAAMGRMFQRGDDKKLHHFTQFTTNLPLDAILSQLDAVLTAIGDTRHRLYARQCVVKAARTTPRGKVFGACQIYQMTPRLFMLEWRKIKGDAFLFRDFFREIKRRFTGAKDDALQSASPHAANSASHNAYGDGGSDDEGEAAAAAATAKPNRMTRHSIEQRAHDTFVVGKR